MATEPKRKAAADTAVLTPSHPVPGLVFWTNFQVNPKLAQEMTCPNFPDHFCLAAGGIEAVVVCGRGVAGMS